jgi:hypothetical protein
MRRFIGIGETRLEFKTAIVIELTLDIATSAADRLTAAVLLSCWEVARETVSKEIQIRAESKALRQPRLISITEKQAMRKIVETKFGKLANCEIPGDTYIAEKLEECEQNNPQASHMDQILSAEDGDLHSVDAMVDPSGRLQITHKKGKIKMPSTPEQFRQRLRIEMNVWHYMASKFVNRSWLTGLTTDVWLRYTDHFLGPKVNDLTLPYGPEGGDNSLKPPWELVLGYEKECRKRAFQSVREDNVTLADALKNCTKDSEIKELYFTTPLALMMSKPKQGKGTWEERRGKVKKQGKGNGKASKGGNTKGGGKTKGKSGKSDIVSKTADGRLICFAFNNEGCSRQNCSLLHVCRRKNCQGDHSMKDCPFLAGVPVPAP